MNIIPGGMVMTGTIRTYNLEIMASLLKQIEEVVESTAERFDIGTSVDFVHSTSPTINDIKKAELSREAMTHVLGEENIDWDAVPAMTAEDFGEFSSLIPVSYIWIGNAEADDKDSPHSQPLHNPRYGFNDDIIPIGAQYFVNVVKTEMPMTEGWDPEVPLSLTKRIMNNILGRLGQIKRWFKSKLRFLNWKKKE